MNDEAEPKVDEEKNSYAPPIDIRSPARISAQPQPATVEPTIDPQSVVHDETELKLDEETDNSASAQVQPVMIVEPEASQLPGETNKDDGDSGSTTANAVPSGSPLAAARNVSSLFSAAELEPASAVDEEPPSAIDDPVDPIAEPQSVVHDETELTFAKEKDGNSASAQPTSVEPEAPAPQGPKTARATRPENFATDGLPSESPLARDVSSLFGAEEPDDGGGTEPRFV